MVCWRRRTAMPHRSIRRIIKNQEILTAPSTTTVTDAARLMRAHKTGALMVCDKKRLVGVFTERDALFRVTAEGCDPKTTLLADVMTSNPQTIGPDKPLGHALHMMYEGGVRESRGRLEGRQDHHYRALPER